METFISIALGLGLAAACGFRVFVPFLVMSVATRGGHLTLGDGFDWIGSDAALITFAAATALEIGAYFVPWLDNSLDTVATPAAVVAGTVVTAATVTDMSPLMAWSLALIGGGGLAGAVQGVTSVVRGASSLLTAGVGNPVLAAGEAGSSVGLSLLSITLPVLALLTVVTIGLGLALRRLRPRREIDRTDEPDPATTV